MDKYTQKERTSATLRAVMKYRDIGMAALSKGTGISYRSIENYYYGRNLIADAKAYNIIEIERFLDIDGRILTGSKSIEEFYDTESKKRTGTEEQSKTSTIENVDYIVDLGQELNLKLFIEYYRKELRHIG